LLQQISNNYQIENKEENTKEIEETLNTRLRGQKDIGVFLQNFYESIQSTCKKTFKRLNSPKTTAKGKSVPWWTDAQDEEKDK